MSLLSTLSEDRPIGIFDSGVGGLSVVRALLQLHPGLSLHYVADSGHAPYGDGDPAHAVSRSLKITEHLLDCGATMVVVACNTATAAAIDALRERYPTLPLVGVEPGVKPAVSISQNGRIGVMATPSTLKSPRFSALVQRYATGIAVTAVPCAGLAAAIEQGAEQSTDVQRLLDQYCAPLRDADVDTVVLGCTHYPFVSQDIARRLGPGVQLLDTSEAVAKQVMRLGTGKLPTASKEGDLSLESTGDVAVLERLCRVGLGRSLKAQLLAI